MSGSVTFLRKRDLEECRCCVFVYGDIAEKRLKGIIKQAVNGTLVILDQNAVDRLGKNNRLLEAEGVIFRLFTLQAFPFDVRRGADSYARSVFDDVYAVMKDERRIPSAMLRKLYGNDQVDLAYRKFVLEKIRSLLVIDMAVGHVLVGNCLVHIHIDSNARDVLSWLGYKNDFCLNMYSDNARIFYPSFLHVGKMIRKSLYLLKILALPFYVISRARMVTLGSPKRKGVELLLPIFSTDWRFPASKLAVAVDWPVDGCVFNADNTLFVSEDALDVEYRACLDDRGYNYVDLSLFAEQSLRYILETVLGGCVAVIPALAKDVINGHALLLEASLKGMYVYYQWTLFLLRWQPKRLLCYQGVSLRNVFRNILLKNSGCDTWRYDHTFNFNHNIYIDSGAGVCSTVDISFLNYSYELHWGELNTNAFLNSGSHTGEHITVKPIWGYVFDCVRDEEVLRSLGLSDGSDHVLVSAFNTSFGPTAYSDNDAHAAFLEALEAFLESDIAHNKNILVLFKGKYPIERYYQENDDRLSAVARRLIDNPRVLDVGNTVSPTVLIKISQLVVSMAYTSTSVEALMLNRRSVYFDHNLLYKKSIFLQFDRFVSAVPEELIDSMAYWLGMDDDTFEDYLDGTIKPFYMGCCGIGENPISLIQR